MDNPVGKFASLLVRIYQKVLSPLLPPSCRFYPTCSEYSRVAFLKHGFWKGFYLTLSRLIRCNPWNPGGFDPVPPGKKDECEDHTPAESENKHGDPVKSESSHAE